MLLLGTQLGPKLAHSPKMLRESKGRTCALPTVSVAKLQEALEAWFLLRGSRDLATMLKPLADTVTWRCAPNACVLGTICDLMKSPILFRHFY